MKVKVLNDGGYTGMAAVVGKVFNATDLRYGYDILLVDLEAAGYKGDGSLTSGWLCFFASEVEVIEE
jgi:hypothetical protein